MQLHEATQLELRLFACTHRCETELPASELETTIVSCLGDAGNELQRLRNIIAQIQNTATRGSESYPRTQTPAWYPHVVLGQAACDRIWVRWCGVDGIYRWLHPTEKRWAEEPEQRTMPHFTNYGDAYLAVLSSPEPPTWQEFEKIQKAKK